MSKEQSTLDSTGVCRSGNNRIDILVKIRDENNFISFLNWSIYIDTNRVIQDGIGVISNRDYFLSLSTADPMKKTLIQLLKEKLPEDEATKAHAAVLKKMVDQKEKVQPMVDTMKELQESSMKNGRTSRFFKYVCISIAITTMAILMAGDMITSRRNIEHAATQKKEIKELKAIAADAYIIRAAIVDQKIPIDPNNTYPEINIMIKAANDTIGEMIYTFDPIIQELENKIKELKNSDEYIEAKETEAAMWERVVETAKYTFYAVIAFAIIWMYYYRQCKKDNRAIYNIESKILQYNS